MNKALIVVATIAASLVFVTANAQNDRQWGVDRSIVQVSDSVYRWGSDNQYGAYIVGTDSIAVVDGHYCPSGTMQWLKAEIERRHTVPVRYVILSHDHPDHVCNSQVFADTAIAIGHTNIIEHMIRENRPSMIPEITFDESMDLRLGGVTVNLMYLGPSHSDNLIQVHVPEEKVMVAVDLAKGKSLFPDYRDMDVHSTLRILKRLSYMGDIETVLPGHGPVSDQQSFSDQYDFLQALRDAVLAHIVAGRSLAEIRDLVTLEEFSDYAGYDRWFDQNVVTMWDYLYRYREPNQRITEDEAVLCREDVTQCRTADP